MTRIIAGVARGRTLAVPRGSGTRPTSDRTREGLFNTLGSLAGLRLLDLYAGTGAVGLEALSRGAAAVTLVESAAPALATLRANVSALGLPGADVVAQPVERWLAGTDDSDAYDVVFLDPPYALDVAGVLPLAGARTRDRLVVERATRDGEPPWPQGIRLEKSRKYGETTLWYGARS